MNRAVSLWEPPGVETKAQEFVSVTLLRGEEEAEHLLVRLEMFGDDLSFGVAGTDADEDVHVFIKERDRLGVVGNFEALSLDVSHSSIPWEVGLLEVAD